MKAKEYLMQIAHIESELAQTEGLIRELRAEIKRITKKYTDLKSSWPDGQPHGTMTSDPTGEAGSKLADALEESKKKLQHMEAEEIERRSDLYEMKQNTIGVLSEIQNVKINNVLYFKYVQLMTDEEIAEEMGYDPRHIRRLHNRGLKIMETIIEGDEES